MDHQIWPIITASPEEYVCIKGRVAEQKENVKEVGLSKIDGRCE